MCSPGTTEAASQTYLPDSSVRLLVLSLLRYATPNGVMIFNCNTEHVAVHIQWPFMSDCVVLFNFSVTDAFKTLSNIILSFHTFSKTDGWDFHVERHMLDRRNIYSSGANKDTQFSYYVIISVVLWCSTETQKLTPEQTAGSGKKNLLTGRYLKQDQAHKKRRKRGDRTGRRQEEDKNRPLVFHNWNFAQSIVSI